MQPNALLLRQNFIIRKKWVLHPSRPFCFQRARLELRIPVRRIKSRPFIARSTTLI
jgi:hypothetical protein